MPVEWVLSIVVPIFKVKGYVRNCSCRRAVKHIELGISDGGSGVRKNASWNSDC